MKSKVQELKERLESMGYTVRLENGFMHVRIYTKDGSGVAYAVTTEDIEYNDNILDVIISGVNSHVRNFMTVKEEHKNG